MEDYEIFCAISGIPAPEGEGIPDGWIKLTIERRYMNPKWMAIQLVKESLIQQTLGQLPEDQKEIQQLPVQIQVEAQYIQLEQQTEQFFVDKEDIYISDPRENDGVAKVWNSICEQLGIEEEEESESEENEGIEEKEE